MENYNDKKTDKKRPHSPEEYQNAKRHQSEVCGHRLNYPSAFIPISCDDATSNPCMDAPSTSTSMSCFSMPSDNASMYWMMAATMPCFYPTPMMVESMWSGPPREVKIFSSCTLYPPSPQNAPPSRRARPDGCKTVFVGWLPEKITKDIIVEAFSECGEIETVRMHQKMFCHIRFSSETHVEKALLISGYRIQIEDKTEPPYCSRLHVDYAKARRDEREYECLKRAQFRVARHEARDQRPPSPPPIEHYSRSESEKIRKMLKIEDEEIFKEAYHVLVTWLKRGECNKRNAPMFYSMITSTNSRVEKLTSETEEMKLNFKREKEALKQKFVSNMSTCNEIVSLLECSLTQKVSDNFSKAQRKQINVLKKSVEETAKANWKDLVDDRVEDEMDLSDDEEKESEESISQLKEELGRLSRENGTLREENEKLRNLSLKIVHQIGALHQNSATALKENLVVFRN